MVYTSILQHSIVLQIKIQAGFLCKDVIFSPLSMTK